MLDLVTDRGFVKEGNMNEGYSTQNKYSRANLRTNMDIDVSSTTKLKVNILGTLSESLRPGASANLWDMIYTLPAAAFPVRMRTAYGEETIPLGWEPRIRWLNLRERHIKGHTRSLICGPDLGTRLVGCYRRFGIQFQIGL